MSADNVKLRSRAIVLPGRGGEMSAWEMGPQDQPIDLIFSHANGFNGRTYRAIVEPLAVRFRILLLDQRGHGRSRLPANASIPRKSWNDLVDDLGAALEALDARDVVLAGHSMGGTVSTMTAAAARERVRGLVLLDPVILPPAVILQGDDPPDSPLVAGAQRRRAQFPDLASVIAAYTGRGAFRNWTADMLADYVADGFHPTSDGQVGLTCTPAWEASGFMSSSNDPWPAFDVLQMPMHILRAEAGSTCRIEGHEARVLSGGRVRLETIPGTSHFLPMERPDLVRDALREMLETTTR